MSTERWMASKMATVDNYAAASMQRLEMAMVYSDLELAYQLQLQEALAASSGVGVDEGIETGMVESEKDDISVAVALQDEEFGRVVLEMKDSERAAMDTEKNVIRLKQCLHDQKVAQHILDMPDEDWDEVGDEYEQPFQFSGSSGQVEANIFELFFYGITVEGRHGGIGWVLLDDSDQVLCTQSKRVGENLSALDTQYAALLDGLAFVRNIGIKGVNAYCSSQVVCTQVPEIVAISRYQNEKACPEFINKRRDLRKYWDEVWQHVKELSSFELVWISVAKNRVAYGLAKEGASTGATNRIKTGGTSSGSKTVSCIICLEDKLPDDMYVMPVCSHTCCTACMTKHSNIQVQENQVPVRCPHPKCTSSLPLAECAALLSGKMFDKLSRRLAEAKIPEAERIYCPYPNCSALISRASIDLSSQACSSSSSQAGSIGRLLCRSCHRLFCVECQVPWHDWMSCSEYRELPSDLRAAEDAKLYQLAKNLKWQRCKKCNRMIELAEGCYHMTCFCGYEFCYTCGASWEDKKQTCACKLWDEHNIVREPLRDMEQEDFAHGGIAHIGAVELIRPIQRALVRGPYKTRICRFWSRGNCRLGHDCTFAHGIGELRREDEYLF